ncbi:NIF3 1 [Thiomicrospira cyclica]|uniref:NGG1p interacting factor NIF3 n=1 Tax=Thiomicrospira cyclica (strain DSM 14477 / JCM 11371 / ALM1) TaxID=717773 RepID=F6D8I9_THICA|nr:NIF3 1 [Thiomicrospira cyclica]AEG31840.1 hypothetical protein Thicy_1073 [Thiomicrospira cyclica ALM1]
MSDYKLVVFVPKEAIEAVKQAIFSAGAGRLGHYDACSWQVLGEGQFRPLAGSQPFIGELDAVERVAEYRLETLVAKQDLHGVLAALKQAHPYEEPAFEVVQLVNLSN